MPGSKAMLMVRVAGAVSAALVLASCGGPVGDQVPAAVAAPQTWRVYVTNERSGDLTVIEAPSNRIIATVALGKRPRGSSLSADGKLLFVALSGSPITPPGVDESTLPPADKGADGIGVFDTATLKLVTVLRGVSDPEQVVVSPDGKLLFIASEDTGTLVIWDVAGKPLASIPAGGEPEGVAVSPDGGHVYVTSEEDHAVTIVDTVTHKPLAKIEVGSRPRNIAFSPDGSRAYVPGETGGLVTVIDTARRVAVGSIAIKGEAARPMGAVVSPDNKTLFVSTGRGGTLVSIDIASLKVLHEAPVGQRPWGIGASPDGKFIYTANGPSNDVSVVDAKNLKVMSRVKVGESPWGVSVGLAPKP